MAKLYARQPGLIPVEEFSQEDRERALELLLSQERVVTLLYAKTFPANAKSKSATLALDGGADGGLNDEDIAAALGTDWGDRPKSAGILGGAAGPDKDLKLPAESRPLTSGNK